MAAMPQRLKSVEQKRLEGNPGKRALPDVVSVAGRPMPGELEEPPRGLPADAKLFWRTIIVQLTELGVLDRVDVPQLENLAVAYARIVQARRVIAEDGHFCLGSMGQIREHPALAIERAYILIFDRLASQYALTPVARTALGYAELHRRSLAQELEDAIGSPALRPVDVVDSTAEDVSGPAA
jgi:P27 family predicted phage terminase small subunit